jgi:hypothetical protein
MPELRVTDEMVSTAKDEQLAMRAVTRVGMQSYPRVSLALDSRSVLVVADVQGVRTLLIHRENVKSGRGRITGMAPVESTVLRLPDDVREWLSVTLRREGDRL